MMGAAAANAVADIAAPPPRPAPSARDDGDTSFGDLVAQQAPPAQSKDRSSGDAKRADASAKAKAARDSKGDADNADDADATAAAAAAQQPRQAPAQPLLTLQLLATNQDAAQTSGDGHAQTALTAATAAAAANPAQSAKRTGGAKAQTPLQQQKQQDQAAPSDAKANADAADKPAEQAAPDAAPQTQQQTAPAQTPLATTVAQPASAETKPRTRDADVAKIEAPSAQAAPVSAAARRADASGARAKAAPGGAGRPAAAAPQKAANNMPASVAPDAPASAAPSPPTAAAQRESVAQATHAAPAAAQVGGEIIRRFNGESTRFEMRLDPPELGRVEVRLDVSRDHRVTAVIATDNPQALNDLSRASRDLQQALQSAGLELADNGLSFDLSGRGDSFTAADQGARQAQNANAQQAQADEQVPAARAAATLEGWRGVRVDLMA